MFNTCCNIFPGQHDHHWRDRDYPRHHPILRYQRLPERPLF
jgi:hypothetical protein